MLLTSKHRGLCVTCLHPPLTCYCEEIQRFDSKIKFVILIHGREAKKRIATGRMSHLCLENSLLLDGYNYTNDQRVNDILNNPNYHCVILYPSSDATRIDSLPPNERIRLFPREKELVIFVVDGTWITARKTLSRSENIKALPRICFEPQTPSRFRVRLQPKENFCSTLEAIHQTIELLGETRGFDIQSRTHDGLLNVFNKMVEQQITLSQQPKRYCLWRRPN